LHEAEVGLADVAVTVEVGLGTVDRIGNSRTRRAGLKPNEVIAVYVTVAIPIE